MTDTDILAQLHASAADFCTRALPLRRLRTLRTQNNSFDGASWREMAALGWAAVVVPEARGGMDLGAAGVATLCRALGRVVAPEPLLECGIASAALLSCGKTDAMEKLIEGQCVVSLSLTQVDWQAIGVHATRLGNGFRLHGMLEQVPLAPSCEALLVPATVDGQAAVFLVPTKNAGVEIEPFTLADYSADGRVILHEVEVSMDALIVRGEVAINACEKAAALAAIGGAAYLHGLCEALLEMTLEYTRTRRQFGRAIGSFQALQHRLADLYLHNRLTGAVVDEAVAACDRSDTLLATYCVRARYRACETAMLVIKDGIQLHGAIGYTEDCDVALYVQRALVMMARFGVSQTERTAAAEHTFATHAEAPAATVDLNYSPPNNDWNVLDDITFQRHIRAWIEHHYPAALRHYPGQVRWEAIKDWHHKLIARGWAAPAWPREYGGMALTPSKLLIFIEELERWGVARAPDQGIVMIGPTLIRYGNDEQRARFLKPALTGEHIWCQGYSEPNAGSDLASLSTRAVLEGDEFIVTGQKTWTTHGLDATHMYCLARTDAQVKPQAGISFLLIDLNQPGVTVRPIKNLSGDIDFCEVFLENVRVPRANLVGELNQGWTIAKALLGFERLFVGSPKLVQHALNQLREWAQATGAARDPVFMESFARAAFDVRDLEALYTKFAEIVKRGEALGAEVALLKIWATETYVRLSEMIVRAAGPAGGRQGAQNFNGAQVDVLSHFYQARPAPIYAGSNEIQRNIIAKQVLNLPT